MIRRTLTGWGCVILWVASGLVAAEKDNPPTALEVMRHPVKRAVISAPLDEALVQFEKLVGVRLEVDWEGLISTGLKRTDKVTVNFSRITGEQLLDIILAQTAKRGKPLGWYVDENVVRVTTQMRILHRPLLPSPPIVRRIPPARARRARPPQEIRFEDTPLEDVIAFFRDALGLNLYVNWPSLELIGVFRDTSVTLRVSNVSFARALTLVLEQLSTQGGKLDRVYWIIDRGVVTIATGAALDTRLHTRVYEVADLLMVVPNFPAQQTSLGDQGGISGTGGGQQTGGRGGLFGGGGRQSGLFEGGAGRGGTGRDSGVGGQDVAAGREELRASLVQIIRDSIGEDMWQPIGKGSIRLLGNKLIISQSLLGFRLLEEATGRR